MPIMPNHCSNPSCSQLGTSKCGRCKSATYCTRDCQKAHWAAHKATCSKTPNSPSNAAAAPKSNCYILRAPAPQTAPDAPPVPDDIAARIEPFHLSDLGNEAAEKRQLERHCRWKRSIEVGKFYDHAGSDAWYYYVYGDARAFTAGARLPPNEAAGLVCHQRKVFGDVAVVRSGPLGSDFEEEFGKMELAEAVRFYRTNDKDKVFAEREMSRVSRVHGVPAGSAFHVQI